MKASKHDCILYLVDMGQEWDLIVGFGRRIVVRKSPRQQMGDEALSTSIVCVGRHSNAIRIRSVATFSLPLTSISSPRR